jgi:carbonic anhydrase
MSAHGKFATAINCMDGRVQQPASDWIKKKFGLDYVDTITEPGPNKILAENQDSTFVGSIRRRADISVNKHGSKVIAVLGHHDCAGNPVDKETQIRQIKAAMKTVSTWGFDVQVIGLWIDENWKVSEVK